jgi:hypothetical protein
MKRLTFLVPAILVACCSALNGQKPFERVETFPTGEQEGALGSLLGIKDTNTVTLTVSAPYAAVWSAVKAVAKKFDKVGNRPVVTIDEQSGRVQNGRITSDALIGSGGGLSAAWADEVITEATQLTSAATTYVYKDYDNYHVDLNSDGSFLLVQQGKQYRGHYTIEGEDATLTIGKQVFKYRLTGSSTFVEGYEWVRTTTSTRLSVTRKLVQKGGLGNTNPHWETKGSNGKIERWLITEVLKELATPVSQSPSNITTDATGSKAPESASALSNNNGDTSFTNTDIAKLVEAKLPDSVIISKIKSSSCNFDVSTDGPLS